MQQSRKQFKVPKAAAQGGDAEAARFLLAHSVALGHDRLSVRRHFAAQALGAICEAAAQRLDPQALAAIARQAMPHCRKTKIPRS